jgi:hypothetical protein
MGAADFDGPDGAASSVLPGNWFAVALSRFDFLVARSEVCLAPGAAAVVTASATGASTAAEAGADEANRESLDDASEERACPSSASEQRDEGMVEVSRLGSDRTRLAITAAAEGLVGSDDVRPPFSEGSSMKPPV